MLRQNKPTTLLYGYIKVEGLAFQIKVTVIYKLLINTPNLFYHYHFNGFICNYFTAVVNIDHSPHFFIFLKKKEKKNIIFNIYDK